MAKEPSYTNEAAPYVSEYFARSRLAKLGFTSDFNSLTDEQIEVFLAVDAKVEEIKAKEMAKKR